MVNAPSPDTQRPSSLLIDSTRSDTNDVETPPGGTRTRRSTGSSPSPTGPTPRKESDGMNGSAGKRKSMTPPASEPKPFVRRCACLRHKEAAIAAGLLDDDSTPKKPPTTKKAPKRPSSVPPKRSPTKAEPEISRTGTPAVTTEPNSLDFEDNSLNGLDDPVKKQLIPLRYSTTIFLKISSTRRRFADSVDFEVVDLTYDDIDGRFHEPVLGSKGWYISEHCVWD